MKKVILMLVPALMLAATAVMAQCPGGGLGDRGNMMIEKRIEMGGSDMMMGQGRGMGRGQWWENDLVAKEIGLSDEQSKRIDALATAHRKEMIKLEADLLASLAEAAGGSIRRICVNLDLIQETALGAGKKVIDLGAWTAFKKGFWTGQTVERRFQ